MGTGRPAEGLCDLVVHVTTYLHFVPPVRTKGDILPMLHIDIMWLTTDIMVVSVVLDKNCLNIILLSSCSYTTATAVGINLQT
jgi:hypothetical protein